jgi:hypothetical protein
LNQGKVIRSEYQGKAVVRLGNIPRVGLLGIAPVQFITTSSAAHCRRQGRVIS